MPYEKTVETEQTVNTLNRKDDGYENLEISKYGSKYVEEKSAIKTFKPKLSKEAQTQEGTSKKIPRPIQQEKTAKHVKGRADPMEAPPSSAVSFADERKPPESEGNSEYVCEALCQKRESTSFDKNKKDVVPERLTSSVPTANNKKKKIGCCTLL